LQSTDIDDDNPPDQGEIDVSNLLHRIRFTIKKLRDSLAQKKAYKLQCQAAEIGFLMMTLDVSTRWNSTFYMLERLIKQNKKGFNNWIATDPTV